MGLLTKASVAIDGSKFKAVNNRDRNFTRAKAERRRAQLEGSVARYLSQLDTADLQEPSEALAAKTAHLKEKLAKLEGEMQRLAAMEKQMLASPDQQISLTDPDSRSMATSGRAGKSQDRRRAQGQEMSGCQQAEPHVRRNGKNSRTGVVEAAGAKGV